MRKIVLLFIFVFTFVGAIEAYSNSISITPSQLTLSNGQSSSVSVMSNNTQPVYSMLIKLIYDPTIIVVGNIALGSDAQTCHLLSNSTSGQTMIGIYCTSPIASGYVQVATVGLTAQNIGQGVN